MGEVVTLFSTAVALVGVFFAALFTISFLGGGALLIVLAALSDDDPVGRWACGAFGAVVVALVALAWLAGLKIAGVL